MSKRLDGDKILRLVNGVLMTLVVLAVLYPLYFVVVASVSEPADVAMGRILFLPSGVTGEAYRNAIGQAQIWIGYRNSLIYTAVGTFLSVAMTIPAAYVLSKRELPGRNALSWYFLIIMYIGGGLIPTYLVVKSLGLLNKFYTLMIVGGFSVYNMVVSRVYFDISIPGDIYEAARIDGCSDFGQFFKIALPLAAPIVAVIALFYASARWNEYFNALIYISKSDYYPLQLVLRNILVQSQTALTAIDASMSDEEIMGLTRKAYMAEAMKYALIILASFPMLVLYPFVQKYFVKGMMIGSVKG